MHHYNPIRYYAMSHRNLTNALWAAAWVLAIIAVLVVGVLIGGLK